MTSVPVPGLFDRRVDAALTQEQLADKAGLKRLTVSRLERGEKATLTTVHKLADALNCRPVDLMRPST